MTNQRAVNKLESVWAYLNYMFPISEDHNTFEAQAIVTRLQRHIVRTTDACFNVAHERACADKWRAAANVRDKSGYDVIKVNEPMPTSCIGVKVEIPVHYEMWMRGAKYGRIRRFVNGFGGVLAYFEVELDHPQARRYLRVWRIDWPYMRVLAQ